VKGELGPQKEARSNLSKVGRATPPDRGRRHGLVGGALPYLTTGTGGWDWEKGKKERKRLRDAERGLIVTIKKLGDARL